MSNIEVLDCTLALDSALIFEEINKWVFYKSQIIYPGAFYANIEGFTYCVFKHEFPKIYAYLESRYGIR